jgi:hypothetical protein
LKPRFAKCLPQGLLPGGLTRLPRAICGVPELDSLRDQQAGDTCATPQVRCDLSGHTTLYWAQLNLMTHWLEKILPPN